jgi:uncharacterized delta-60 repeat protein
VSIDRALTGVRRVQLVDAPNAGAAIRRLRRDPAVAWAERDVRLKVSADDPRFSEQWGLQRIGAPAAWRSGAGGGVPIAVIDTGIAADHADLGPGLWTNPGESGGGRESNGLDDDDNGFVDDVHGWDFHDRDGVMEETTGHGTHVAGIAAAHANNGAGVAGVVPAGRVMPVRVFWVYHGEAVAWGFELAMALSYAADNGARVINLSAGGPYSHAIDEAVRLHPEALLVTAAGNAGADLAGTESYPCELPYENVLCVAASNRDDSLASFSNHGTGADIAAPGVDVLSSYPARANVLRDDFEGDPSGWLGDGWAITDAQASSGTHSLEARFTAPHRGGQFANLWYDQVDLRGRYSCWMDATIWSSGGRYPDGWAIGARAHQLGGVSIMEYPAPSSVAGVRRRVPIRLVDDRPEFQLGMSLWAENGDVSLLAAIDDLRIDCVAPELPAGDRAEPLSGTSMATPFVAGAAALIWGRAPKAGPAEVRRALLDSCAPVAALHDKVGCGGRLDVHAAAQLALADALPPEPPEPEQPLPELPLIEGARPGDFDPSFGQGGIATIDLRANADEWAPMPMGVWPDAGGGVTAAAEASNSEWVLSRVRQDGTPDRSFGTEGRMRVSVPLDTTPYAGAHYDTNSVVRDADGRILLSSARDYPAGLDPMVIQRRLPDGSADTSFGDGGHVLVPLPSRAISELPLAPDAGGGVIAAENTVEGVRVVRLRSDGSRDPGFGNDGIAAVALDSYVSIHQVHRDDHGRILIAGRALHRGDYVCAVARLAADGTLDESFGEDGVDWTSIPVAPGEMQLAVAPDGRLLVALGTFAYLDEPQIVVARRLPDGGPDPTFGHDGNTVAQVKRGYEHFAADMAALPDGRVLVATSWSDWTGIRKSSGGLLRFNRNGSLDHGWADRGVMALPTEVGSRYAAVGPMNLDADGRALTAGVNGGGELVISRTLGGRLADEGVGGEDPGGEDPGGEDPGDGGGEPDPSAPSPPPPTGAAGALAPVPWTRPRSPRALPRRPPRLTISGVRRRGSRLLVTLRCAGPRRCVATLVVERADRKPPRRLASRAVRVQGAGRKLVRLRLAATRASLLRVRARGDVRSRPVLVRIRRPRR